MKIVECSHCEGEDGGLHGEGRDEVPGEHQDVQAGEHQDVQEFRDGEEDVPRIQPDLWPLSSPRSEL